MNDPLPPEQLIAPIYGALYWLLYYQIGRDLFPETPVHALSAYQERVVKERTAQLIDDGRRLIQRGAAPPDDQR